MKFLKLAATITFFVSIIFASVIQGFAKGSCGSCGVPEELEKNAETLKAQFSLADRETLQTEQFVKTLCSKHDCGAFTEEQASLLLARTLEEKQRNDAWWFNLAGVLAGAAGVIISLLVYFQSKRQIEDRSGTKSKPAT